MSFVQILLSRQGATDRAAPVLSESVAPTPTAGIDRQLGTCQHQRYTSWWLLLVCAEIGSNPELALVPDDKPTSVRPPQPKNYLVPVVPVAVICRGAAKWGRSLDNKLK